MASVQIKLEYECERGHWVGVVNMDDDALRNPRPTVSTPAFCPHVGCATALKPWVRRKKGA